MVERALAGLVVYGLVGPVIGGVLFGLDGFLRHPSWSTAAAIFLFPLIGFPIGFVPAAATGAVAGALAPSPRQAHWHLMGVALLGAALSAVSVRVMLGEATPLGLVALVGFVASLACERLLRWWEGAQASARWPSRKR
jgi:hypothetical protein